MADREHDRDADLEPEAAAPEAEEPEAEEAGSKALADALKVSFFVLKILMVGMVGIYLAMCVFQVQPQQVKFKQSFGRVVPSWGGKIALRPGTFHIKWPWQQVREVSTEERTLVLANEYWTNYPPQGGGNQPKRTLDVRQDGYLLTGDANIVHMQLRCRYSNRSDATGAMSLLFGVQNPEEILRRLLMAATVKVVGSMRVMEVLNPLELFGRIEEELKVRVAAFERRAGVPLGIEVQAVEAVGGGERKNPTEPQVVSQAFVEAQNASSRLEQLREEGKAQKVALLEDGLARVGEIKADAEAYKQRLVMSARADAEAMQKLLPIYTRSEGEAATLRDTFYLRVLTDVLRHAWGTFVLYKREQGREIELMIGGRPPLSQMAPEGQKGTGEK